MGLSSATPFVPGIMQRMRLAAATACKENQCSNSHTALTIACVCGCSVASSMEASGGAGGHACGYRPLQRFIITIITDRNTVTLDCVSCVTRSSPKWQVMALSCCGGLSSISAATSTRYLWLQQHTIPRPSSAPCCGLPLRATCIILVRSATMLIYNTSPQHKYVC